MQLEQVIQLFRSGTGFFAVLAVISAVATIAVAFFTNPIALNGSIKAEEAAIQQAQAEREALKKKKRVIVSYVTETVQRRLDELFELPPQPKEWSESRWSKP